MKKILFAILVSATGLGLYSCNNGAYDLDPKTNNGAVNPLNPDNKISIPPGNVKVDINGVTHLFYPGFYLDSSGGQKVYFGYAPLENDPIFKRTIGVMIGHTEGKDPDFTDKTKVSVWYSLIDTFSDQRIYYIASGDAKMDVNGALKGREGDAIRGTLPEGEYIFAPQMYDHDTNQLTPTIAQETKVKSMKLTKGEFHLMKTNKPKDIKYIQAPGP
jgi:hypothetical protein